MRKYIYKLFGFFAAALVLSSCVKEMEDVFDDMPTVRLQKQVAAIKSTIHNPEDTWVMTFFSEPTILGGYAMVMHFGDEVVSIQSDIANDPYEASTSSYSVKSAEGPVISFDTYNEWLHFFADPQIYSAGSGLEGDFEFVVMDLKSDALKLKGIRHGLIQTMKKLPADMTATQYMDGVVAMTANLDAFTIPVIDAAGEIIPISYGGADGRIFEFTYTSDGGEATGYAAAFAFTNNGIVLYEPIVLENISYQNFVYDAGSNSFICSDPGASDVVIKNLDTSSYLYNKLLAARWWFKRGTADMGPAFTTTWALGDAGLLADGEYLHSAAIGTSGTTKSFYFISTNLSVAWFGNVMYNFTFVAGYPDRVILQATGVNGSGGGDNGSYYMNNVQGFNNYPKAIGYTTTSSKTYTMTLAGDNTNIRFVDVTNPDNWFVVYSTQQSLLP